eukprot:CAMPEP_0196787454 /NCGR_PEP_ID=MMETSP1104-20130614/23140_1 /TAXON_ID=33652 /ORGANISM="Cafeteria sp., Strain Caron Lab Isolate" /LENGTH=79 /DNA_ID=CAMNT_0042157791 /DNA_START=178 /DNA_END=417 /DNA_ORIENTATION=-
MNSALPSDIRIELCRRREGALLVASLRATSSSDRPHSCAARASATLPVSNGCRSSSNQAAASALVRAAATALPWADPLL